MSRIGTLAVLAGCLLTLGVAGCGGGSSVDTTPVSGTITLEGKPVVGATVSFAPQSSGLRTAVGVTDSQGRFTLQTAGGGAGAMVGTYKVAVAKTGTAASNSSAPQSQEEGMSRIEQDMKQAFSPKPPEVKHELPRKYASADESGLIAQVTDEGPNDFTFELTVSP